MPTAAEIEEAIRTFLSAHCNRPAASISGDTRFEQDLGLDSFDLVTLLIEIEDSYGVVITDAEAAQLGTIREASDFIAART